MSLLDAVKDFQNESAYQKSKDYADSVKSSSKEGGTGADRNVGGAMGKNDFLTLLVAQLRYQNPLEPQDDSAFASQLAQFTSLEQLQNMNTSMNAMAGYQAYSLVGKFVLAEGVVDGKMQDIAGVVDSVFVGKNGLTYAQIGEYEVLVSSIREVFDSNNILTTEMFMQTSSQLIGRTVVAEVDEEDIEGIVTRILVDKGKLIAQIDDGTGEPKFVPVNAIVDIRETGTDKYTPKPKFPPNAVWFKEDPDSDGFLEYDSKDLTTVIGRWDWDKDKWEWVYTCLLGDECDKHPSLDDAA